MKTTKVIGLLLCGMLVACGSSKEEEKLTDPKVLYESGMGLLNKDNYGAAVDVFEQLEREHPASDVTAQAQVYRAYSLYLSGRYEEAVMVVEEFVKQYPASSVVPYMFYLKGLCYYDQILDVSRDQELSRKAVDSFAELTRRFPNSRYARDAQLKIDYAQSMLAGKEMDIGRFYLKQGQLISALGRFKVVVDDYQSSVFIDEALYRMAEIYYTFGDDEQATVYASVLGYNYPDSPWYQRAHGLIVERAEQEDMPWYSKVMKTIW